MARKTRIAAAIERAQRSLTSQVFAAAMAEVPGRTPMGEVIAVLKKEGFAKHLESMTLSEFLAAAGVGAAPSARRPGRPAGVRAPAAGRGAKKSFNTRTEPGRQALDGAIAEFLSAAGSARAEAIRGSVGASPAQIRQSMTRLMGEGKVTRKGQKRGTEYHWKSGSAAAGKPASRKASTAKTSSAKTSTAKAGASKKARRGSKRRARGRKAKARAAKG